MEIRRLRKIKYSFLTSIPTEMIEKLDLNQGDYVTFECEDDKIIIRKVTKK